MKVGPSDPALAPCPDERRSQRAKMFDQCAIAMLHVDAFSATFDAGLYEVIPIRMIRH